MVREKEYIEREFINGNGIYCFFPFDNLDKNGYGVFKIGMSMNFHKRIANYHTYLPEGVYYKCFLENPTKNQNDMTLKNYYTMIEKEIFNKILLLGGKAISMNIRYKDEGRTEWVYANEKIIEKAFDDAYKKYKGDLTIGILDNLEEERKKLMKKKIFKGEIIFV